MPQVYLFPGQGSQFKGMGKALFGLYPDLVAQADKLLGYSIEELCLNDPDQVLNRTDFTQPALYVVNALSYLEHIKTQPKPEILAGHSLGEFNALMAAGAFDFITGLAIVKKRGELMAKAQGGGMAAIIGMDLAEVKNTLTENNLEAVDLANINAKQQIIISGLLDDLSQCQPLFKKGQAKYIPLKVSAAFHSRHMIESQKAFSDFLRQLTFNQLQINVVSNWTGDLYPESEYTNHIENQLSHPVKWYQSISRLIASGYQDFVEIGPGTVLTKLAQKIIAEPSEEKPFDNVQHNLPKKKNVLMYSGQGSQYYEMGKELYEHDEVFKKSLDRCHEIIQQKTGRSLLQALYAPENKLQDFNDLNITHPAIFSFGYSITQSLLAKGLEVDAVLGYSLGEYVAATIAGSISLEDALNAVLVQATVISKEIPGGGMLTVLTNISHYYDNPSIYQHIDLAGINYEENFVLSGEKSSLLVVQEHLDRLSIPSMLLPVEHGFHSKQVLAVEKAFKASLQTINIKQPDIPVYSSTLAREVEEYENDHFWNVTLKVTRFSDLLNKLDKDKHVRLIDCSPTGTLSNFVKYSKTDLEHHCVVNPFGRNLETMNTLINELCH